MKTITANGDNYFGRSGFPLLVGRSKTDSEPGDPPPHPHDLTEVKHRHDFSELVIVLKGQGIQWLNGNEFPINVGDIFLLQGHQRHYFHHRKSLEMINVMFDPEKLSLPENELRRMPGYCLLFMLEPAYRTEHQFASRLHLQPLQLAHVQALSDDIQRECDKKPDGFEVVSRAKLLVLISYLSRIYNQVDTTETQSLLRVSTVISALENNYAKAWKLEELAILSHMSANTLMSVFRKGTGKTPIEYLVRIRIQHAMELLRLTRLAITEIAFEVGFNDSNYFTRQFKRATGDTPSQFRAKQNKM